MYKELVWKGNVFKKWYAHMKLNKEIKNENEEEIKLDDIIDNSFYIISENEKSHILITEVIFAENLDDVFEWFNDCY